MHRLARIVVALRWILVPAWIAAAAWAVLTLPSIGQAASSELGALLPSDSEAIDAERAAREAFPVPLHGQSVIVERPEGGLGLRRQREIAETARAMAPGGAQPVDGVLGVIPVTDALLLGRPPAQARVAVTTVILDGNGGIGDQWSASEQAAARFGHPTGTSPADPQSGPVKLTGVVPARTAEADVILERLHWVELATAVLVALLVGLHFRSVGAPVLALATVAVAYGTSSRAVAWAGERVDLQVPEEVQPILVVLVFGVTTDYVLFLLDGFRRELCEGRGAPAAAARALGRLSGPILAAGLSVVGATAVLVFADLELLRGFGPGMALAVLISLIVALTFVPCAAALFGRLVLWPRVIDRSGARPPKGRMAHFATHHPLLVVVPCVAVLLACAAGLSRLELGEPLAQGLPEDTEVRQASRAAGEVLPTGITDPAEVIVRAPGVANETAALSDLGERMREQPGVGLVLGPGDVPQGVPAGLFRTEDGGAARYLVAWQDPPLGASAVDAFGDLRRRMPELTDAVGLDRADALVTGNTSLTAATIDRSVEDLLRVTPLAVLVVVLTLVVLLRAVLAPLYLVAASLLALLAALGAASWFFIAFLGQDGLSWIVPVAATVLLLSLGADYTVFLAGRIWRRAARGGALEDVVARESAEAARPIRAAAVVLAASFALLALVPLRSFEQIAFTVVVGLLLDAFIVRSVLVPALVVLFGPGRRLRARAAQAAPGT